MTVHTLEAILELKRKKWENKHPLLADTIQLYEDKLEAKLKELASQGLDAQELKEEREFYTTETKTQISELKRVFTASDEVTPEDVPIPEYLLDPISFNIFVDPVISNSGQSYERSWILEHLRKNSTDPFSRKHLTAADLVPNLALKAAAEEFINKYGKTF
ncbi:hypothetical protein D0Z00_002078 [Geotrichum galactomycetum]|uniref:Uncharacterized protein n=1 Tax=Geotrichum galactomycetum TaxID=27317 RepID=A0ACB6V567_9ASCO|nr:hypothetical protein D0Z00_002078 [Geotrichum candidum]